MHSTSTPTSLPAELWTEIIHHVSYIPGALTTTDLDAVAAFTRDDYAVSLHWRYAESLATKLALSSVCYALNELTRPFLYEYIIVRSGQHALSIAQALETRHRRSGSWSSNPGSPGHHPSKSQYQSMVNGKFVKRLEIATYSQHIWDDTAHAALLSILHLCPNLSTFSDAFCSGPSNVLACEPILNRLSYLCVSRSLRRFEWASGTNVWLVKTLRQLPSLRVFFLASGTIRVPHGDPPVSLPSLRLLVVGKHRTEIPDRTQLCAPKLLHFVTYCSVPVVHPGDFEPGTYPIVSTLRTLHVPVDNLLSAHRVLRECDLESLTLHFDLRESLKLGHGSMRHSPRQVFDKYNLQPNLERISISGLDLHLSITAPSSSRRVYADRAERRRTIEHVRYLLHHFLSQSLFPSLRSIGLLLPLMNARHGRADSRRSTRTDVEMIWVPEDAMGLWDDWLKSCAQRSVRVYASVGSEDHTADVWRPFAEVVRRVS